MPKWVVDIMVELQSMVSEGCVFVFMSQERWLKVKSKWVLMREAGRQDEWENKFLLNNVLRDFKKKCFDAGIKTNDKLTVHCLRKAYGCNLANAGTPIQTLKKLMGHSSINTTMEFYLQSSDANEKKAVFELERIMGGVGTLQAHSP